MAASKSNDYTLTRRLADALQKRADKNAGKRNAKSERARDRAARKRLLRENSDVGVGNGAVEPVSESIELDRLRVKPVHYVFLIVWMLIAFLGSRLVHLTFEYDVNFFSDFSILIIFASVMFMLFCFRSARSHSQSYDVNIVSVFEYMLRRGKNRFTYRSVNDLTDEPMRGTFELKEIIDMPVALKSSVSTDGDESFSGEDAEPENELAGANTDSVADDASTDQSQYQSDTSTSFGGDVIDDSNAAEMLRAYKARHTSSADEVDPGSGGEYSKPFYAQFKKEKEKESSTEPSVSGQKQSDTVEKTAQHSQGPFGSPAIVIAPVVTAARRKRSSLSEHMQKKQPKTFVVPVEEIDSVTIGNQTDSVIEPDYLEKNARIREMNISDRSQLLAFVSAYIFGAIAASGLAFII